MKITATFLLADARSGSTLLDQCLGAHQDIVSLGEVHWLPAYAARDRSMYDPEHPLVCSCGLAVPECAFWNAVQREVGRPLSSLRLHARVASGAPGLGAFLPPRRLMLGALEQWMALMRRPMFRRAVVGTRLATDSVDLFNAVAAVSGRRICIDSSKSVLRFRAVFDSEPRDTRALILTRDVRAVVHSKMKRGRDLEAATRAWVRKMRQIEALTADLAPDQVHSVKYESFCSDPAGTLAGICKFLGVQPSESMVQRPTSRVHHVGGSPSKFDQGRISIVLDRAFESHLDQREQSRIAEIAGITASRWGY